MITGNHDTVRAAYFLDERELKLAYAFLFTMPGNPFLYYGDEIGMRYLPLSSKEGGYTRTGSRTPMQWDDTKNHGFSTAEPDQLYLPVDMDEDAPTVAAQMADNDSLWHVVKEVLAIRSREEALREEGNLALHYAEKDKRAFAYRRGNLLMCCNPSGEECTMDVPKLSFAAEKIFEIGTITKDERMFVLGAQSFAIWKHD